MIQPTPPSPSVPPPADKSAPPPPLKEGSSEFDHVMEKIALDVAKDFWKEQDPGPR